MTNLLEDLKFFIGTFFVIVGVLLLIEGLTNPVLSAGYNLNLIAGTSFLIFALVPLWISVKEHLMTR